MGIPAYLFRVDTAGSIVDDMADFLSVLSIAAFIAVFSGLIWALDRV
jgi:hypothetical protein